MSHINQTFHVILQLPDLQLIALENFSFQPVLTRFGVTSTFPSMVPECLKICNWTLRTSLRSLVYINYTPISVSFDSSQTVSPHSQDLKINSHFCLAYIFNVSLENLVLNPTVYLS